MTLDIINKMKHSPIKNYVLPGVTSWLIGDPTPQGCVRLFEASRNTREFVTPHNHRYDFTCRVLEGAVMNTLWTINPHGGGDAYEISDLHYDKQCMGGYNLGTYNIAKFDTKNNIYSAGKEYSMLSNEIHSISFEKDTKVLFFEGPQLTEVSQILQPVVDGEVIPHFRTEPWMFKSLTKS